MKEEQWLSFVDHLGRYNRMKNKIKKFCDKNDIIMETDIEFNDDLHFQFWKEIEGWPYDEQNPPGTKYTECWVSKKDIVNSSLWRLARDLKGFLATYFKLQRCRK